MTDLPAALARALPVLGEMSLTAAYAAAAPAYEESYDAAPSRDTSASSVFSKY